MTSIEWTDATWNPTRGCSRVSEGCRNCYAERIAARFSRTGQPFRSFANPKGGWTGRVELVPEKLDEPLHWRKPRRVFVNSMSDLFHNGLLDRDIDEVFGVMAAALNRRHVFQILTKRPARMRKYFDSPVRSLNIGRQFALRITGQLLEKIPEHLCPRLPLPNVWLGVSVEDQRTADERIPLLLQTPAVVRFVSYEPALGPVGFGMYLSRTNMPGLNLMPGFRDPLPGIDWIIIGGESGPGARPFNLSWARNTVAQCRAAGVPVFVKQLGAKPVSLNFGSSRDPDVAGPYPIRDSKGGDPAEWPEGLRVREFPDLAPGIAEAV